MVTQETPGKMLKPGFKALFKWSTHYPFGRKPKRISPKPTNTMKVAEKVLDRISFLVLTERYQKFITILNSSELFWIR